jgi:hypothetical protein
MKSAAMESRLSEADGFIHSKSLDRRKSRHQAGEWAILLEFVERDPPRYYLGDRHQLAVLIVSTEDEVGGGIK